MSGTKMLGDRGETETARYLRAHGCTLLASQWRCRFGELDLVARDRRGLLLFVEVKLRSDTAFGLPREFVTAAKRQRLRAAAESYMSRYELDEPARFDVAEVYTDAGGRVEKLVYLKDAFS